MTANESSFSLLCSSCGNASLISIAMMCLVNWINRCSFYVEFTPSFETVSCVYCIECTALPTYNCEMVPNFQSINGRTFFQKRHVSKDDTIVFIFHISVFIDILIMLSSVASLHVLVVLCKFWKINIIHFFKSLLFLQ